MGELYYSVRHIATLIGWRGANGRQRCQRWLAKEQALVKIGGRYFTTKRLLQEAFPEVWQRIVLEGEDV